MVVAFSLWSNGLYQLILKFHQTLQPQTVVQPFWAIPALHYVGLIYELDLPHISILELVPLFRLPVSGACFGNTRD